MFFLEMAINQFVALNKSGNAKRHNEIKHKRFE